MTSVTHLAASGASLVLAGITSVLWSCTRLVKVLMPSESRDRLELWRLWLLHRSEGKPTRNDEVEADRHRVPNAATGSGVGESAALQERFAIATEAKRHPE